MCRFLSWRKSKTFSKRQSRRLRASAKHAKARSAEVARSLRQTIGQYAPAGFAGLSQDTLRQWLENLAESTASAYDKAMDATYLKTNIGGGNHRMFDGGHDLAGAFEAAQNAKPDDSFIQEVAGYAGGLWRDLVTVQGLPFVTWPKAQYEACAQWVSQTIPGASRSWFYDLCSFDAVELAGASLGVVGAIFFLNGQDIEKLWEMLGAMGITSVAGANPLAGIAVICVAVYAYAVKKHGVDTKGLAIGAGMTTMSLTIFSVLGLPFLLELAIALVGTSLLRKHVIDNEALWQMFADQAREVWRNGAWTRRLLPAFQTQQA